jgi:hypothetical protein
MPAEVGKPPLFYALASFVLVIACLSWGRVVLIPVALAKRLGLRYCRRPAPSVSFLHTRWASCPHRVGRAQTAWGEACHQGDAAHDLRIHDSDGSASVVSY